jgi:hypothetical protein
MRPAYLLPAPPPRQRPADVLDALASQLRQRGLRSLIRQSCDRIGVLSLPAVTVWTNGRVLWWRTTDRENPGPLLMHPEQPGAWLHRRAHDGQPAGIRPRIQGDRPAPP